MVIEGITVSIKTNSETETNIVQFIKMKKNTNSYGLKYWIHSQHTFSWSMRIKQQLQIDIDKMHLL